MKRFSILCCLVLLLNVLCPVACVHAEGITTPTDLCDHEYGLWAEGDDCVYGCLKCKLVERRSSHALDTYFDEDSHWGICMYCDHKTDSVKHTLVLESNEESHRLQCTGCEYFTDDDVHIAFCNNPGVCAVCGYKDENLTVDHDWGGWADGDECVWGCLTCGEEEMRREHMASCSNPTYCQFCGAEGNWYSDHNWDYYSENGTVNDGAAGHHYLCLDCGAVSETFEHYARCDAPTYCTECGYEGEMEDVFHPGYSYNQAFDENSHWFICSLCNEKNDVGEHWSICDDPTHCVICDYEGTIDDVDHTDYVYTSNGASGHAWTCPTCGKTGSNETHYAFCTDPTHCLFCNYEGAIDEIDHNNSYTSNGENEHIVTCRDCGYTTTDEHLAFCFTDPNSCWVCDYEGENIPVRHYRSKYEGSDNAQHWYTCSECEKVIKEDHKWGEPVTEGNVRTYTCTICKATKTENLHTHKWGDPVTVEPTCTKEGTTTYTCTCGKTKVETIAALGHSYGACMSTGSGAHAQTCAVCGSTVATTCTMVDTKLGNLDAAACIYCGYITWKLDDAGNGKQESKAVANATFEMTDENGAAIETNNLSLVVYESAPEATILLDTGASLAVKKALTITVLEDSTPVKLASTVKLSIPMEDDLTGLKLLVVDENGELVEIEYEVIDGVMVFETDILGIFMLVQEL